MSNYDTELKANDKLKLMLSCGSRWGHAVTTHDVIFRRASSALVLQTEVEPVHVCRMEQRCVPPTASHNQAIFAY